MEELRVTARGSRPRTCLYCRTEVAAPTVCDRCDATYHADCLAELGRCATPGCRAAGSRAVPRPAFARDWRETAPGAAAEAPRAPAALARPATEGSQALLDLLEAVAVVASFALLLLAMVFGISRAERSVVDEGTGVYAGVTFGSLFGPFVGPVAVVGALRALRDARTQVVGALMLLLLLGAAGHALATGGWWTVPYHVSGASVGAAVVYVVGVAWRRRSP